MLINLDVANGYTEQFVKSVALCRKVHPKAIIMAGNVVTPEQTKALIKAGADIVKVGIGPGAQCETRAVAGVGYPQLSAIIECAKAAHSLGAHICADGGCKTSGDIAKAFAAGADFVMLGTMLAGHKETISDKQLKYIEQFHNSVVRTIGQIITGQNKFDPDKSHCFPLEVYGMSSTEAMNKYHGGVAQYRSSEGRCSLISYRGTIYNTLHQIFGGLRSACTYVGAGLIEDLPNNTKFVVKK